MLEVRRIVCAQAHIEKGLLRKRRAPWRFVRWRTLKQASPDTTAVRLIALLPRRTTPNTLPSAKAVGAVSAAHLRALMNAILVAMYVILSLGIQFIAARRDPPVCTDTAHTPAQDSSFDVGGPFWLADDAMSVR
jgi:hypothetical protein